MTSPTLNFETLSPDVYDRAKSVLDKAKHPGFVGRELFFRCATRGKAVVAVLDGIDVGVALISEADKLQALSVIIKAQGKGIGKALVRHLSPKYVSALGEKTDWFARLGYQAKGSPRVGKDLHHTVQLMERTDDAAIVERVERTDDVAIVEIGVRFKDLSLLEFIPKLSPEMTAPTHLEEWCDLIELSHSRPGIRGLCDVPIRHYKTETTLHGIVWLLVQDPTREIIFLTHTLEAAQARGKRLRQLAEAAGVGPVKGTNTITHWNNDRGGGVVVMSAQQSKIGYNCHALIVDDPIDEDAADDPNIREVVDKTIAHYTARCMRRGKPGPVLILMSRWHPDDPIGRRLIRSDEWTYIHHPVINEDGTAFAPNVWDLPELEKMRAELKLADPAERIWFAQLMGDPQPDGADLFRAPHLYDELPTYAYRVCHGVDFAYTDAPGADFFAAMTGRIYGRKLYIVEVQRHRLDATLLESTCKAILNKYGRAPMWSYQSGPEVGLSRLLIERGVPVVPMQARYNKLVRAQKTIRRWNDGEILVPSPVNCAWQPGFLHRVSLFRGHEKDRDDEIDAVVSAADAMLGGAPNGTVKDLGIRGHKPYGGFLG